MPSISGTRPTLMGNLQQQVANAVPTGQPFVPPADPGYAWTDTGAIAGEPPPGAGGGGYPQPVTTGAPRGGGSMSAGRDPGTRRWGGYRDWLARRRDRGGSLGGEGGGNNGGSTAPPHDDPTRVPPIEEGGGFPQPIDTAVHGSAYVPAYTGDIASGWGVGPTTAGTGLANSTRLAQTNW